MATIALNYSPIGQMSGFFEQIKTSISNYQSEILTIQTLSSAVDSTIYNLDDVISEVQTSTTLQDEKIAYIGTLDTQMQTFVDNAVSRDQQAAEEINASKDDFYERYEYLKPDIEKSGWEKFWDWSAENWEFWATVVLVVVAVVLIVVCTVFTGGGFLAAIAPVLLGIAKGILVGALLGGALGGIFSALCGGGFWSGFWEGAFLGAISGAIMGGFGAACELTKWAMALLCGGADAFASALNDIFDNIFKGENNSLLEIIANAGISFSLGFAFSWVNIGLKTWGNSSKNKVVKFLFADVYNPGINGRNNSWSFSYNYWLGRYSSSSTIKMSYKTIFNGFAADLLTESRRMWWIETPKAFVSEKVDGD